MVKLTPNIDRRGRRARLVAGIILAVGGAGLVIGGLAASRTGLLIGGVVVLICGSFTIFEAANGWCLLRAMGIRTRI